MPHAILWLFALSCITVFYVLLGYPLILALLVRSRSKPIAKRAILPTVSIIVPVYDGARFIQKKIESILALEYPSELI